MLKDSYNRAANRVPSTKEVQRLLELLGVDDLDAAKRGLLERAVKLLGRDELARRLNIPTSLFDDWVRGDATMPDGKLMELARTMDKVSREQK